jgi:metal-responsive CopG/Arc/MetJ family transcriptional regulator
MKVKTSVSLSEDLVAKLDKLAGPNASRSAFIEQVLRDYLASRAEARRSARDVIAINRHAEELNAEMKDVLSLQADVLGE